MIAPVFMIGVNGKLKVEFDEVNELYEHPMIG